jgi:hypothetical protein
MSKITFRDFLALSAEKAGMKEEKELLEFLEAAQNQEILALEIPSKAKEALSKLMNGEQAINDTSIRNRLINEALTPVDNSLKETLKSNGFSDAEINDLFAGKKTHERVNLSVKQVLERAQKAIGMDTSEKTQSLKQKLEITEKELERIAQERLQERQQLTQQIASIKRDRALEKFLSKFEYDRNLVPDPDIDPLEIKKMKLNASLSKSGYSLEYDDSGNFELYKVGEGGVKIKPFNDLNGKVITAEEWVGSALSTLKPKAETTVVQNAAVVGTPQTLAPSHKPNAFDAELAKMGLK